MAVEEQPQPRPGLLEIAFKIVQASLATLAVYRSARAALKAWQGIVTMIRGDGEASSEDA